MRSGKVTLWDHSFELPHKHLEAEKETQASVKVGGVEGTLALGTDREREGAAVRGELGLRGWEGAVVVV